MFFGKKLMYILFNFERVRLGNQAKKDAKERLEPR